MLKQIVYGVLSAALIMLSGEVRAQMHLQTDDAQYELAVKAMQQGKYQQASKIFRRAARGNLKNERRVSAYNNLCVLSFIEGAYEQAEKACSKAIALDENAWRAYVNRSVVREARGKVGLAITDKKKAGGIAPEKKLEQRIVASIVRYDW